MIQGKDLRLGNYVKNRNGRVIRIDYLSHVQEGYDTKFGQFVEIEDGETEDISEYASHAEPVEITEESLTMIGFRKLSSPCYQWGNDFFGFEFPVDKSARVHSGFHGTAKIRFRCIHELQNFYYFVFCVDTFFDGKLKRLK